ncbi:MAG: hypothetical protein KA264_11240 [Crocinitomicaceae bacterium]|nr:hypothetical protein [Crocinitomicaceae bacterium]
MVAEASVTGLLKTIFIIIGVMVVLKYIGQLMVTKRNISEQNRMRAEEKLAEKQRAQFERNKGKISILRNVNPRNVKDVDYEEIN